MFVNCCYFYIIGELEINDEIEQGGELHYPNEVDFYQPELAQPYRNKPYRRSRAGQLIQMKRKRRNFIEFLADCAEQFQPPVYGRGRGDVQGRGRGDVQGRGRGDVQGRGRGDVQGGGRGDVQGRVRGEYPGSGLGRGHGQDRERGFGRGG